MLNDTGTHKTAEQGMKRLGGMAGRKRQRLDCTAPVYVAQMTESKGSYISWRTEIGFSAACPL